MGLTALFKNSYIINREAHCLIKAHFTLHLFCWNKEIQRNEHLDIQGEENVLYDDN